MASKRSSRELPYLGPDPSLGLSGMPGTGARSTRAIVPDRSQRPIAEETTLTTASNESRRLTADSYERSSLRRFAQRLAVLFVFLKFGLIHELLAELVGFDTKLVLIVGLPLFLTTIVSGAVKKAFHKNTGFFWLCFGIWMALAVPFSFWIAGSFALVFNTYFRTTYPLFFVLAGLPATVQDINRLMRAIAFAALVNCPLGVFFADQMGERLSLSFSAIANPGDLAAHFLLGLPFLWYAFVATRSWVLRLTILCISMLNLQFALLTGTRSAVIALVLSLAFLLVRGTARQKLLASVVATAALVISLYFIPASLLDRYATFTEASSEETSEAAGSAESRIELARRAVKYSLENPLFGIGPGMFIDYDRVRSPELKQVALRHVAHNGYLDVLSEVGILGFCFYVAAVLSAFLGVERLLRNARAQRVEVVATSASCLRLAMVIHGVILCFLSIAYAMYVPILLGLAVGLARVGKRELEYLHSDEAVQGEIGGGSTT